MRFMKHTVSNGPFANAQELIAGFWLIQAPSRDEAIEWVKRCPFHGECQVEIRQVFEGNDYGPVLTPELKQAEARLRAQTAGQP